MQDKVTSLTEQARIAAETAAGSYHHAADRLDAVRGAITDPLSQAVERLRQAAQGLRDTIQASRLLALAALEEATDSLLEFTPTVEVYLTDRPDILPFTPRLPNHLRINGAAAAVLNGSSPSAPTEVAGTPAEAASVLAEGPEGEEDGSGAPDDEEADVPAEAPGVPPGERGEGDAGEGSVETGDSPGAPLEAVGALPDGVATAGGDPLPKSLGGIKFPQTVKTLKDMPWPSLRSLASCVPGISLPSYPTRELIEARLIQKYNLK